MTRIIDSLGAFGEGIGVDSEDAVTLWRPDRLATGSSTSQAADVANGLRFVESLLAFAQIGFNRLELGDIVLELPAAAPDRHGPRERAQQSETELPR